MTITLKYFGLLADITNTNEELFSLEKSDYTTTDLMQQLHEKYTGLQNVSFVIAVNKSITSTEMNLNNNDTIALLPPFAGG
ncbi:MoaD/ThiS family protein [uncultured Flavobacterium sp.]|uniref:MoaD/ThiS family protein n=1 Tax=uncultured Flavobacterium sp. TaxID=165435 RepID=UPI0030EDBFAB|tara:strand:+ start:220979 stop:221221 length:243 start_codon:yes stop_codon:yes gene_type:complete